MGVSCLVRRLQCQRRRERTIDCAVLRQDYGGNLMIIMRTTSGLRLGRMDEGDFSAPVIHDLHWTLERWPNHYLALQAIQRYEAGGGHADMYVPVSCYFQRAKWFVPDDANILVLHGIYEHKKGHDDLAEQYWIRALQIDDNAVEAHYNLGLLYFSQKSFSRSIEHAQLAYELGYPLPGLRTKLMKQGYWEGND